MLVNDLAGPHIGRKVRYGVREGFLVRVLHEQDQQTYVRLLSPDLLASFAERLDPDTEIELLPDVEIIDVIDADVELVSPTSSDTV